MEESQLVLEAMASFLSIVGIFESIFLVRAAYSQTVFSLEHRQRHLEKSQCSSTFMLGFSNNQPLRASQL